MLLNILYYEMRIKNLILLLFIFVALNSFYQSAQRINIKPRHTIVRQINFDEDKLTKEVLAENEKILFRELIAIKLQIMLADNFVMMYNTS